MAQNDKKLSVALVHMCKMMIPQVFFFHIFKILIFGVLGGVKG